MKTDNTTKSIPESAVLSGYEEEDRAALSSYGKFLVYDAGETVIREKEKQECLYFVISGTLDAIHKVRRGKTPLGTIEDGEWFGEVNIFDPQVSSAEVVAKSETHVWRVSRPRLEEFLNNYPDLGCLLLLGVAEILAKRTRALTTKLNATWELSW